MTTTYYDHAKNQARPAVAHAVAAAARDAKGTGTAWTVTFQGSNGQHWWAGCAYDALVLAKQLVRNGYAVVLTSPQGTDHDHDAILAMRY